MGIELAGQLPPGVRLREFEPGGRDRDTFRRLNEEWLSKFFRVEDSDRKLFDEPEKHILHSGGTIFIVESQGEPVACCALMPIADGYEIAKLAVTERHQGRGLGKLLLRACIERAKVLGAPRLFIETSSRLGPAIALYRKFGFLELPPGAAPPSEFSRADVFMELRLSVELPR